MLVRDEAKENIVMEAEGSSLSYAVDFKRGRISGIVDGAEAVKQAIRLALLTPRFECLIYSDQYGSEVGVARNGEVDREYLKTVLPLMIEDALLADSRILEVSDIEVELVDEQARASFTVHTIFGDTDMEIVM